MVDIYSIFKHNILIMEQNLCKYFNICGGCQIQGLGVEEYKNKKLSTLKSIFEKANLSIEKINDIITLPVGIRRRANLKIDFGCNVGFYKHASNDVVSIKYCQMLCYEINNVLKYLPIIFKTFVKRSDGSIFITKVENGLTFHFENINITPLDLPKLKAFAQKFNIIQISSGKEILYESEVPFIIFNNVKITYPINTFLQPSKNGEECIVNMLKQFVGTTNITKVADIFCGLGLFSFYLKDIANEIFAVDCNEEAIKQINKIARQHNFNIKAKNTDLFSHPIRSEKLNDFDLLVLDPPRDGAEKQVKEIASSDVKHIIYVSCNPITFARDAKILIDAGFKIKNIQPIDQFTYTNHLELIADIYK